MFKGDNKMKKLLVSSIVILSSLTLASCSSLDGQYKKSSNDKKQTTKQVKAPTRSSFKNNVATLNDKTIKITGVKTIKDTQEYSQPLVVFMYKTTNKSNKIITPLTAWNNTFKITQKGKSLKKVSFTDDRLDSNPDKNLAEGDSAKNSVVYELDNQKDPIKINASEGISINSINESSSIDGTNLGSEQFSINNN
ncbi:DUF5067 domain-containing protein [Fructilactobacillus sanfranciscensis]|nr:hypothetical protein FD36_GL001116 [Fructilactobacillus sanfranciscensis DSM 20451]QFX94079.1 DUF5067 domain-containing protein [Fructilactobacillus sanfranciscensis]RDX59915.1 DUF5067 domain-containing protein [Fructilactobacillus sanfranciscensis]